MNIGHRSFVRPRGRLVQEILITSTFYLYGSVFSYIMLQYYIYGDQEHYTRFWNDASAAIYSNLARLQLFDISSVEPLFGVIIWLASRHFSHDVFISLFNGVFVTALALNLRKFKTPPLISLLILTNFYTVVLLVPAERVKFAFTFFLLSLLFSGWKRVALLCAAPLCHFQIMITYGQIVSAILFRAIRRILQSRKMKKMYLILLTSFMIFAAVFLFKSGEAVARKLTVYGDRANYLGLLKIVAFYFGAILSCRDRWVISGAFLSVLVIGFLVGPQRINMLGYMAFAYFFLSQRKFYSPIFLLSLFYFSYRTIHFIHQTVIFGVMDFS